MSFNSKVEIQSLSLSTPYQVVHEGEERLLCAGAGPHTDVDTLLLAVHVHAVTACCGCCVGSSAASAGAGGSGSIYLRLLHEVLQEGFDMVITKSAARHVVGRSGPEPAGTGPRRVDDGSHAPGHDVSDLLVSRQGEAGKRVFTRQRVVVSGKRRRKGRECLLTVSLSGQTES